MAVASASTFEPQNHTPPVVYLKGGRPLTNSRYVAQYFGKRHDNVIRDIRELKCSEDYRLLNFEETFSLEPGPKGAQVRRPMYEMTKDGFVFLAMGFTGEKAGAFKEAYITKYNLMAAELERRSAIEIEPRRDTSDQPLDVLKTKLQLVREARHIFGVNSARTLWSNMGLPTVNGDGDNGAMSEAEGLEALDRIMDFSSSGLPLRDWLRRAIEGSDAAERELGALGVRVVARPAGVAFANRLFERFPGLKYWHLRGITGAERFRIRFDQRQERGTFLPIDVIEQYFEVAATCDTDESPPALRN